MARGIIRIKYPPIAEFRDEWVRLAVQRAALRAIEIINDRVRKGADADGGTFKPYSKNYARLKASTGRNVLPPDLTLSGAMLNNLKLKRVEKSRAVIGFEGQHRQFRFSRQGRKFVGLDATMRALRKRTLKRTNTAGEAKTTSMAVIVLANDKRRPFFHIRSAADRIAVIAAAQSKLEELVRAFNRKA
jgi:hypothetical protein